MMSSFPPIPASPMIFAHLLGLVFVIHILFFNFVLASPIIAAWSLWFKPDQGKLFAKWLTAPLPAAFTFTINFGVACLLFVQVLYPDRFYTANIILGKAWLSIIIVLMAAFYLCYILLRSLSRNERNSAWAGTIGVIISVFTLYIAGLMVSNYFLTTDKTHWNLLLDRPWLVVNNLTFIPRFLHYIIGSFAVTGFWMVWISWWRQDRGGPIAELTEFRKMGLHIAAGATGLQIIVGVWFLIWLPSEVLDRLFSGTFPSLVWICGVACGLVLMGLLIVALANPEKKIWQRVTTILLIATIGGMDAGRDVVRHASFGPDFHVANLPSQTQGGPLTMFLLLLIGGVLVGLVLLRLIWRLPGVSKADS